MKDIEFFDSCVPRESMEQIYSYVLNSNYRLGWTDNTDKSIKGVFSLYSYEDLLRSNIMTFIPNEIKNDIATNNYKIKSSWVNLVFPGEEHCIHYHTEDRILLYYVNIDWKDGDHGETLFYNDDHSQIKFGSPYVPGRFLYFKGTIPHAIRPSSNVGPKFRFTLVIMYEK